ncbi:MAG: nucleoside hydrolase [Planctomycetes bacterium]|nr:nucleoside hydrolase [Planctomycetota bacterium]
MKRRLTRRSFLTRSAATTATAAGLALCFPRLPSASAAESRRPTHQDTLGLQKQGKRIPVILDTDIGDDIDDTWALVMMLKSPELDVKLITSDSGNDTYRARLIAKLLEVAGRTDIPVGIGCRPGDKPGRQSAWVGDYDLSKYPGTVHEDGVGAIIDTVRNCEAPMTLAAIGPVHNLPQVLARAPDVADKARFVGMHGSVRLGYGGSKKLSPEYNVRANPKALQAVFAAPWEITITPLDTCGIVHLEGERFQKVYRSKDPLVQALVQNYRAWLAARSKTKKAPEVLTKSSTLFDTVAIYLAFSEALLEIEDLPIRVTDDGYTRIDEGARKTRCATRWQDLDAFKDDLVARLTAPR